MLNRKVEFSMFLVLVFILMTFSPSVSAFETYYDEDFIEGGELTSSLEVLDVQKFSYYGENYSLRVLGVYSNFATVRVEKSAKDIHMDEEAKFNIDDNIDYDISVRLTSTNDRTAILQLSLFDKSPPEDDPEPDDDSDNTDDSSDDDTDDSDDSDSSDSDDDSDDSSSATSSSSSTTSTQNSPSSSQSSTTSSSTTNSDDDSDVKVIDGATTINVSFNFTFTPQSAIGFVLTAIIVVGGVIVYKKSDFIPKRKRKKGKKGKRIKRSKFAIWCSRFWRKFKAWLKVIIKKLRVKTGELIAGERILTKDELRNRQLKVKKKRKKV
jgi:hypothetical protein